MVAMAMNVIFGVQTMNVVNSNIGILINNYIALKTLTIVKNNFRSPFQSSTTKILTNQLLESEWG